MVDKPKSKRAVDSADGNSAKRARSSLRGNPSATVDLTGEENSSAANQPNSKGESSSSAAKQPNSEGESSSSSAANQPNSKGESSSSAAKQPNSKGDRKSNSKGESSSSAAKQPNPEGDRKSNSKGESSSSAANQPNSKGESSSSSAAKQPNSKGESSSSAAKQPNSKGDSSKSSKATSVQWMNSALEVRTCVLWTISGASKVQDFPDIKAIDDDDVCFALAKHCKDMEVSSCTKFSDDDLKEMCKGSQNTAKIAKRVDLLRRSHVHLTHMGEYLARTRTSGQELYYNADGTLDLSQVSKSVFEAFRAFNPSYVYVDAQQHETYRLVAESSIQCAYKYHEEVSLSALFCMGYARDEQIDKWYHASRPLNDFWADLVDAAVMCNPIAFGFLNQQRQLPREMLGIIWGFFTNLGAEMCERASCFGDARKVIRAELGAPIEGWDEEGAGWGEEFSQRSANNLTNRAREYLRYSRLLREKREGKDKEKSVRTEESNSVASAHARLVELDAEMKNKVRALLCCI